MKSQSFKKGDVVQLNPDTVQNKCFAKCILIVEQPKSWGCVGVVVLPYGDLQYYRASWDEMEFIGHAPFSVPISGAF